MELVSFVALVAVASFLLGYFTAGSDIKAVKAEVALIEKQIAFHETSASGMVSKFSADAKAIVARIKSVL